MIDLEAMNRRIEVARQIATTDQWADNYQLDVVALIFEIEDRDKRVRDLEVASLQAASLLDGMVLSGKLDQHECRNTFQRLNKALAPGEEKA